MPTADQIRLERIQRLFDEVVDLPTSARAAFYAGPGAGDPSLAQEVEDLVLASRNAPGFLERPAAASELEGRMAGPWRIERLLASGGMADVYLGVRDDTELAWRAAVKVLKPELDGEWLVQRFRAEQKVLAALSHPNIVVLLDAGTLDDGRLYLAMELIDGVPIDRYCTAERFDLEQKLLLFLKVAAAVEHAHQRFVVHCDLKPSNVLVTREGVPKLLDFGVATLLGPRRGDQPAADRFTLGYASPEQLRGEVLAATTDVWSLGVLLYELAANRRPFVVAGLTPDEVSRLLLIRPASTSNGDLDDVLMKALEPDPKRRYPSVEQFAADVRRFLEHRPIAARPASLLAKTTKFVRRNRWGTAAALIVILSLLAGTAGAYRGMLGAREEARLGWRAHSQAVEVTRFLEALIEDGNRASSQDAAGREAILDRAAERIDRSFSAYPETEGRLRLAIAKLYLDIERPEKAEPHLRRAVDIMSAHRGFGAPDRLRAAELLSRSTAARPTRPSDAR